MSYKPNKYHFIVVGLAVAILLFVGLFSAGRLKLLKERNSKNMATLNQFLPGFNDQSLVQFKQEIKDLKAHLAKVAGVFDPKDRWFKKDYDLTIHFMEELGKINQLLRTRAVQKQVNFPDIVFKEKLPSEQEAFYLLSQLYGIKEVASLGMDYNIAFKSLIPLGIDDVQAVPGIKIAKSNMELICPAQGLIEFIIQLNTIIPKPFIGSISLKSKDTVFDINLAISNIVMDLAWKDKQDLYVSSDIKDIKEVLPPKELDSIRILRNMNPFLVAQATRPALPELETAVKTEAAQVPRFIYRGKALLKSKEVVVIEDTLNKETVFLDLKEKIGGFLLKEFSDTQIILENMDDGKETIIEREEK
jgi:hypothetical protein